jgi:putative intracellular protease/amidase
MNKIFKLIALLCCLWLGCATPVNFATPTTEYVCPMDEHPKVFHAPGDCPECGMKMVEKSSRTTVAILVFEGVQIIDYSAPYEVFGQAHFSVFTVGKTKNGVTTAMGLSIAPKYDFNDAPPVDVLVVPGGNVDTGDSRTVDWIRTRAAHAKVVLSVCNGAFFLAKAGLLDGLSATTFYGLIDELSRTATKTRVVRDQRFVDNGKIVTSAGLTSGMDASLHVVEKLLGRDKAREVALHLEYNWDPESKYARAALADRYLPALDLGADAKFERLTSTGGLDEWRMTGRVSSASSSGAFLDQVSKQLVEKTAWKTDPGKDESARRGWTFADEQGRAWRAILAVTPEAEARTFLVDLKLERQP